HGQSARSLIAYGPRKWREPFRRFRLANGKSGRFCGQPSAHDHVFLSASIRPDVPVPECFSVCEKLPEILSWANENTRLMKLYVGNIPFETTETDLREVFAAFEPIEDVYMPLDRDTGRPRGFAFVTLGSRESG